MMGCAVRVLRRIGLMAVLVLAWMTAPASAADRAVLVLDSSGSMWGRISGVAKFQIARQAVNDLMGQWDPSTELGITVYGHRKGGSCTDIEDVVKPGRVEPKVIRRALAGIRPKGRTPMTAAVRHAAELLDYTRARATVILLSDGEDSCEADPCAAAETLERDGKDLTVHVIGLDIKDNKAKQQLRCLADKTGGTLVLADGPRSLAEALAEVAALTARTSSGRGTPERLTFKATIGRDGPAVTGGLFWTLYKDDPKAAPGAPDRLGALVAKSYDEVWQPAGLAAGRYILVARLGDTVTRQMVDITETPRVVTVPIDAGTISAQAAEVDGGPPITSGLTWRVASATQPRVAYGYAAAPRFVVPPGSYVMHVAYGTVAAEQPFTVATGEVTEIAMVLGSGLLRLQAKPAADAPLATKDVTYSIYPDGAPQRVAQSYDPVAEFHLSAGRYRVVANLGDGRAEQIVELTAGETVEATLVIGVGTLQVVARAVAGAPPAAGATWKIYDDTGTQRRAGSDQATARFTLPAGRYRAVAELGKARAEQVVEIGAGQTVEADLALDAGTVEPSAIYAADAPKPREGLNWTLFAAARGADGKRVVVASSSELSPRFIVSAGSYVLMVEAGLAHAEQAVEVVPGGTAMPGFDLQAGSIIAEATAGGAILREGLGWDLLRKVETLTGDVLEGLGSNYDARPIWIVPAGRYLVRVGRGETTREKEVVVTAGKPSRVTLGLD